MPTVNQAQFVIKETNIIPCLVAVLEAQETLLTMINVLYLILLTQDLTLTVKANSDSAKEIVTKMPTVNKAQSVIKETNTRLCLVAVLVAQETLRTKINVLYYWKKKNMQKKKRQIVV